MALHSIPPPATQPLSAFRQLIVKALFLLACWCCCQSAAAQSTPGGLSGVVKDTSGAPIQGVTITVMNLADSNIVGQSSTDETGAFKINSLPAASLLVRFTHIAYGSRDTSITTEANGAPILLNDFFLQSQSNKISGVTVRNTKPIFVKQKDRLIVNVDNSIINSSQSDLVSLISRLPGVYINRQSEIMVNGQQRALVLINEKSTMLNRGDLLGYLNTIPVNTVKRIEIIYSPSAKYDAEGSVVINIHTEQNVLKGLGGSVTALHGSSVGYGRYYPRLNAGTNLTFGTKRLSLAFNYTYIRNETLSEIGEALTFPSSTLDQSIRYESLPEQTHNVSLSGSYNLSKKSDISLSYRKSYNSNRLEQQNRITLKTRNLLDSIIYSNSTERVRTNQNVVNASYSLKVDSLSNLTLSGALILMDKNYNTPFVNTVQKAGGPVSSEQLRTSTGIDVNVAIGQADYTRRLNKNSKIDAGAKLGQTSTASLVQLFTRVGNNEVKDLERSNNFEYRENLFTAYLNYRADFKKVNFAAGLRYLDRKISGGFADSLKNNFAQTSGLFPSASIDYQASQKVALGLSYSRRIENPNYIDVNPYISYVNPFTTLEGNPRLIPAKTNKAEMTLTLKDMYSFSASYYKTKDIFTTAQFQDIVTRKQRLVPANVGDATTYEFNFNAPVTIAKWWDVYVTTGVYYQKYVETREKLLGYNFNDKTTFQLFTQHTFKMPKGFEGEVSTTLITPSIQGQFELNTINSVTAGFKRSVFKNKVILKLVVNDLLRTLKYDGTVFGSGWRSEYTSRNDARQILFSLKYNFKSSSFKSKSVKSVTDEELKRLPRK